MRCQDLAHHMGTMNHLAPSYCRILDGEVHTGLTADENRQQQEQLEKHEQHESSSESAICSDKKRRQMQK